MSDLGLVGKCKNKIKELYGDKYVKIFENNADFYGVCTMYLIVWCIV